MSSGESIFKYVKSNASSLSIPIVFVFLLNISIAFLACGFSLSDAHQQTREMAPDVLNNIKYNWKESLPIAQESTLQLIKEYSNSLYEKTFVEAMVYGDFEKLTK
ncbi:hypothetical protein OAC91_04500 [Candidatus Marinimicrobia bacterium]|nr:hypothetical protein [Candidatus Neomarinimicrobiota bacterium]